MRSGLPKWVISLFLVLVMIAIISIQESDDGTYYPSIDSASPSGTRILANLLRDEGLVVKQYVGTVPDRIKTDLVVSFTPIFSNNFSANEVWFEDNIPNRISLGMSAAEFEVASKEAKPIEVSAANGATAKLTAAETQGNMFDDIIFTTEDFSVFASMQASAKKVEIDVVDGIGATNQFITERDNAAFYVNLIKQSVKKGGTVTFWERPFGNKNQPGLVESLSPQLSSAWRQFLLMFVVLVYTLGKPFGNPVFSRNRARGAKEMMGAFGDFLRRSGRASLAAEIIHKNLDERARQRLKIPSDADDAVRNQYLTPECIATLAELKMLSTGTPNAAEVLRAARNATAEIEKLGK